MKKIGILLIGMTLLYACKIKGVNTSSNKGESPIVDSIEQQTKNQDSLQKGKKTSADKPLDTLRLKSGIRITYFTHGKGQLLKKGDMIKLDYRSRLENGKVFDGNNFIKKPYIPFLIGWHQQTEGWFMALKHLRVGDDVDVFIPSKYARGKKGLGKVVPPNSNVIISMHIKSLFQPTATVDGIRIWKYDQFKHPGDSIRDGDQIIMNYWVSSESHPRYDDDYKRGRPTKLIVGDHNIVPGLRKALLYGREGDRLMIVIPPKEGYGSEGYLNVVKPNEALYYDIQIAKVTKKKDIPKK